MSNKEPMPLTKDYIKKKTGETLGPEEAFLAIPFSLRTAMKKHLPLVNFKHLVLYIFWLASFDGAVVLFFLANLMTRV